MRTIPVTGGYSDYAECTITDRDGKDLSTATFKAALLPRNQGYPAHASPDWSTPLVATPTAGEAEIALLVTNSTPPGDYYLWVDIVDNPTVVPVRGCDDTGRPEIVRVT